VAELQQVKEVVDVESGHCWASQVMDQLTEDIGVLDQWHRAYIEAELLASVSRMRKEAATTNAPPIACGDYEAVLPFCKVREHPALGRRWRTDLVYHESEAGRLERRVAEIARRPEGPGFIRQYYLKHHGLTLVDVEMHWYQWWIKVRWADPENPADKLLVEQALDVRLARARRYERARQLSCGMLVKCKLPASVVGRIYTFLPTYVEHVAAMTAEIQSTIASYNYPETGWNA